MKHTVARITAASMFLITTCVGTLLFAPFTNAQITNKNNSEEVKQISQVFRVKVIQKSGNQLRGNFVGLTEKAKELGFNEMVLVGTTTTIEKDPSGVITYDITWNTAVHEPSQTERVLDNPFETKGVKVKPDLVPEDVVTAKGIFNEIIKVKDEILAQEHVEVKEKEKTEEEESEEESSVAKPRGSTSLGSLTTDDANDIEGFSPNFAEAEPEDIVSADGCDIIADVSARTANQYKRIFRDGEPITSCAPSDEEYALTEDYGLCAPSVQLPEGVFEQFTLGYQKEEGGSRIVIQEGKCFVDETRPLPLTVNQCGFEPAEEDPTIFFKKEEVIYQHRGAGFVARPCTRTTENFERQTNRTTCESQVNTENNTFTPFVFHFIVDNGEEIAVSGCIADNENQQNLQTEICTGSNKWFWDQGNTGLAFLQERFYYLENNERVYATSCAPGEQSYQVTFDSSSCSIIHDDTNRRSNVHQKPLVLIDPDTLTTEEIIGENCRDTSNFVPYQAAGGQWAIVQDLGSREVTFSNTHNLRVTEAATGWVNRVMFGFPGRCSNGPWAGIDHPLCLRNDSQAPNWGGEAWCLTRNPKQPYTVQSLGAVLDVTNSDVNVVTTDITSISGVLSFHPQRSEVVPDQTGFFGTARNTAIICTPNGQKPVCPRVTKLEKKARFTRFDNSEFLDTNNVLEDKFVCGFGSLINGVIEE